VAARKASRAGKDWYSISVETLRSWGFLLLILVLLIVAFLVWRSVEGRSVEHQAEAVIADAGRMLQQLAEEKRLPTFASEYAAGRISLDEARTKLAAKDFPGALEAGQKSRKVLSSILDALSLRGSTACAATRFTQRSCFCFLAPRARSSAHS